MLTVDVHTLISQQQSSALHVRRIEPVYVKYTVGILLLFYSAVFLQKLIKNDL